MSTDHNERQLLAIMFTDVVGYTSITERDEETAVRVREGHRDLVKTMVKQFEGEVVDITGDESLSIFPSALRAVDCALALQGALRSYPDLKIRVGIHLGDVLRKGEEIIGEGVNIAARVRPLAEPGGICVSEPVYQMVRSRGHVVGRSLGAKSLHHVSEPVTVYALSSEDGVPAQDPVMGRRLRVGTAVALVAFLAVLGVIFVNRAPLLGWAALQAPRLFSNPIEQKISFVETSDGVRIAYATTGEGPPIVFVLGWATHLVEGMGSPLYDQAGGLSWYSRDHTTVRYDGRGFGLSDRDIDSFSIETRVRDLEAVVDALGLDRFALYAYSAGGAPGVVYASRNPSRVSHLVLAATFADGRRLGMNSDRVGDLRNMMSFIRSSWESPLARATMTEFLAPEATDVERHVLMHFLRVSGNGPQVADFMLSQGEIDASEAARKIRVPTLVIASDTDPTVPLGASRDLAALIPGARFEVLEGRSHIEASFADPKLMRMVSEFLDESQGTR